LPLIATATPANYFNDVNYFDETKIRDDDDLVEQPALRGTLEDIALAAPLAAAGDNQAKAPAQRPRGLCQDAGRNPGAGATGAFIARKSVQRVVPQFSQPPSQRQM